MGINKKLDSKCNSSYHHCTRSLIQYITGYAMLHIQDLSFGYRQTKLFNHLSLSLTKGGVFGLLGKNGAGKTTLLKIIAGLVFPDSGTCEVMGFTPKNRQPEFLADIYFLPEDFALPELTATQYASFYAGFYKNFDATAFNKYLTEFSLPRDQLLTTLSHGQKKKFLISFGLATHCRLLILDEPTNGLDIPSKTQFKQLLAATVTDDRLIIISTHQVHDVEHLVDAIAIVDDGEIVLNQSVVAIAQKLSCQLTSEAPDIMESFYSEKRLGGYLSVTLNRTSQETPIDLEALFNAVLANKIKIQQLFPGAQS